MTKLCCRQCFDHWKPKKILSNLGHDSNCWSIEQHPRRASSMHRDGHIVFKGLRLLASIITVEIIFHQYVSPSVRELRHDQGFSKAGHAPFDSLNQKTSTKCLHQRHVKTSGLHYIYTDIEYLKKGVTIAPQLDVISLLLYMGL